MPRRRLREGARGSLQNPLLSAYSAENQDQDTGSPEAGVTLTEPHQYARKSMGAAYLDDETLDHTFGLSPQYLGTVFPLTEIPPKNGYTTVEATIAGYSLDSFRIHAPVSGVEKPISNPVADVVRQEPAASPSSLRSSAS